MKSSNMPGAATAIATQSTRNTTTSAGMVTTQGLDLRAANTSVNTTETTAMMRDPE